MPTPQDYFTSLKLEPSELTGEAEFGRARSVHQLGFLGASDKTTNPNLRLVGTLGTSGTAFRCTVLGLR